MDTKFVAFGYESHFIENSILIVFDSTAAFTHFIFLFYFTFIYWR